MLADRGAIIATLNETLASCSKYIEAGDYSNLEQSVSKLADFLNSLSQCLIIEGHGDEDYEEFTLEILSWVHQHIASPTLKMEELDALAFELPKAVARFACVSTQCLDAAEDIVDWFVKCVSPRDMLSILLEAIGSPTELFIVSSYFIPLLSGLKEVLSLIQRRQYEQVKTAVPVILNVLRILCSKSEDEYTDYEKLFLKATGIAHSIGEICLKLEGKNKKKLCALLGLYILQIMYFVSVGITSDISRNLPVVLDLSGLLQYCEISYMDLVTGCGVSMMSKQILEESEDGMDCFSQVKLGAGLSVIWGYKNSEVARVANADINDVIMELQGNWTKRWEAIGVLKYLFSCVDLPWELKKHGVNFVLCMMDGIAKCSFDDHLEYSMYTPTMYGSLQAIEMVVMYAPDSLLRKNAFSAFKKVLGDIPSFVRFDVLKALIRNADSPSMIAILVGCIKEELHKGQVKGASAEGDIMGSKDNQYISFWDPSVLELVEVILRPSEGGPPSLPQCSDSVLAALNLYRYILITESTGNSNSTGVLLKEKLQKAYTEWLLPLRTLVSGIMAEYRKDCDLVGLDALFALNPVELVLYRCIELVEEKLEHS